MDFSPRVQELKVEAAKCCCPTVPSATADNDAMGRLPQKKKKNSVIYDRQHGFDRRSLVHLSPSGFFSRSLVRNHLLSNFISHQIYKQTLCVSPPRKPLPASSLSYGRVLVNTFSQAAPIFPAIGWFAKICETPSSHNTKVLLSFCDVVQKLI